MCTLHRLNISVVLNNNIDVITFSQISRPYWVCIFSFVRGLEL